MNSTTTRTGLRCLLICLLAAVCPRSVAQPRDGYLDSLYTYSYLKHRLHSCMQRFTIPAPELRRFQAAASVADSLAKRWPPAFGGPDAYLPYWAAHPELDEDGARAKFDQPRPAPGNCVADSSGYGAARKRLTALQLSAYKKEHSGDTLAALALLDTIGREFSFTNALIHAKHLAIASRDTAAYLRTLTQSQYPNFTEARRKESNWPVATTTAQKAFVKACLLLVDSNSIPLPKQEPRELRRCLVSFADLQSICSDCIFARSALPPFMRSNKQTLRRIYCYLVEESYTAVPAVVCRYLNTPDSLSGMSLRHLSYLSLHLIQLNAFGQIYPDSLFENYFRFLQQLAYARVVDMEDYVGLRDEYLLIVKDKPSEFGYTTRRMGYELSYGIAPSAAVEAKREVAQLLPLEIASARN